MTCVNLIFQRLCILNTSIDNDNVEREKMNVELVEYNTMYVLFVFILYILYLRN
jgi:hypothetical protein